MRRNQLAARLDALVERAEHAEGLDPVADKVQQATGALEAGRIKDLLSGTPFGHPAHPVLVTVPIGSWLTAVYLDVTGGRSARPAARRAIGLGLLAAVPTLATGLSDWSELHGAERRVGLVHAGVNDVAVTLFGLSWLARRRDRQALGVALSGVGAVVVAVGGWIGGHLTYAQGVGVDTTAFETGPEEWADLGSTADVPEDTPLRRDVEGVSLLVVRRGGVFHVLADRCTHRGGPLDEGSIEGGCIVCPWHGSAFDLTDGRVVEGPATRPQPVYEVHVDGDRLLARREEIRSLRTDPVGP